MKTVDTNKLLNISTDLFLKSTSCELRENNQTILYVALDMCRARYHTCLRLAKMVDNKNPDTAKKLRVTAIRIKTAIDTIIKDVYPGV